jgi:hypothetical protein
MTESTKMTRRIPPHTTLDAEVLKARAARDAAEAAQYPAVIITVFEDGLVQAMTKSKPSAMGLGHKVARPAQREFERSLNYWKESYDEQPEWVDGAFYIEDAFGMFFGPLEAATRDEAVEEMISELAVGRNIIDRRS